MSETPVSGNDDPSPADKINDALVDFTGCIGEALDDICSYGLTIGETYVPFDPDPEDDCDEEDAQCSQAWVRVMTAQMVYTDSNSFAPGECGGVLKMTLEVGVSRCLEIPKGGNAPTASDMLVASMQAMTDMKAIHCAAMECEVWDSITSGEWVPDGPLGGLYGGIWTFDVEV